MRDLIEGLCVAAGMIMEDTVEAAVVRGDDAAHGQRLALIGAAGRDIACLADAAVVIAARWPAPATSVIRQDGE